MQSSTTHTASASRRELVDSLLHNNVPRMILGVICGLASGAVFLLITTLWTPAGAPKLWWLHLMGSTFFGGEALAYDFGSKAIIVGLIFHFALSALCGFIVGKLTVTNNLARLMFYGLVLGLLCWLASNMFGPNFMHYLGLREVAQWTRASFFIPFGVFIGLFLGLGAKTLKI